MEQYFATSPKQVILLGSYGASTYKLICSLVAPAVRPIYVESFHLVYIAHYKLMPPVIMKWLSSTGILVLILMVELGSPSAVEEKKIL